MADAPKKMTTQEILAAARAERAKVSGEAPPAPTPEPEPESVGPAEDPTPPAPAKPAAAKAAAPPSGAPKTTADILAAARAQAAGKAAAASPAPEEAAPAEASPAPASPAPAGKPKTTAEILAAARSQTGKPAAPAGPAKSTSDILAAARAAAGKGGAAVAETPAAKPAAAKPAAAKGKAAAPAAAAEGVSVEQMLAAVRPATVAAKVAPPKAAVAPVAPPLPPRPTVAKKAEEPRRGFLGQLAAASYAMVATPFALAWTLLGAWTGAATLMTARFMLPNVLTEPPRKFKIGPPSDYDLGTVSTKWVAGYGVWIVHTDQYQSKNQIYALASVCTHLGCTPSWLEGEQKFKCPCHGSGFYITGVNFEGPAPRPLERVGLRRAEDGMLEVDKSLKFQEEMGQWLDGNSFVEVA